MKSKAIIPLVLGLAVGIATVRLAVNAVRKAQAGSRAAAVVMVVRATQDIDAFKRITAEMVELIETVDSVLIPERDRFESLDQVVGRVAGKPIPLSSAILKSMLAPEGTQPGMVGRIPTGFRAVSVRIDEVTGVAFQLAPGDWVDVIVVMDVNIATGGGRDTIAEVILQNVQVAAIGYSTATGARAGAGKIKPAKSATLMVAERDVPKLHLAATRGKLTLAMRGNDNERTDDPASASLGDIVGRLGKARRASNEPAPSPRRTRSALVEQIPHQVVVFHGVGGGRDQTAIERITFAHGRSTDILSVSLGYPSRGAAAMSGTSPTRGTRRPRDFGEDDEP